jgi:hypothetical protein
MRIWKFDENHCEFAPVSQAAHQSDPDATYLLSSEDTLYLQEGEITRLVAHDETLIHVAGVAFERDQFEHTDRPHQPGSLPLQSSPPSVDAGDLSEEMRSDGSLMRQWLLATNQISRWIQTRMLSVADEPWGHIEGYWSNGTTYLSAALGLSPGSWLPVLRLDLGYRHEQLVTALFATLTASWTGARIQDAQPMLSGNSQDFGTWWQRVSPWFDLPVVSIEAIPLD